MTRTDIKDLLNKILANQGKPAVQDEASSLPQAGFRSLDFSELALRVERAAGKELTFDAAAMRRIQTIRDVLDFLETAASA